ncbi:FDXHR family putative zinc-binding protein [Pseudonocardia parietis]|uniref:FDXHR family putative zinc-binding protein n=1 Tax=Pseudonocardia parietis TaxID=570936 RepID=UPI003FD6C5FA
MSNIVRITCCGQSWVGPDRAHCCRRHGGCGHVFDDPDLWDAHRAGDVCRDPRQLRLVQTKNGIWVRG